MPLAAPGDDGYMEWDEYYRMNTNGYQPYEGPGGYEGYDGSYDDKPYAETKNDNETVVIIHHEQYHKGGKHHKHKRGGIQPQNQQVVIDLGGKDDGYGDDEYEKDDEYDGYEEDYKGPKKHREDKGYHFDIDSNYQPPMRKKEAKNVYNFRAVPRSEKYSVGFTQSLPGSPVTSTTTTSPVVISYETSLTCGPFPGPPGGIGHCYGSGIMFNPTARQVHMQFTCTIDADASNMCGLKYVQGMSLTAQGLVEIDLDAEDARIRRLHADVLPITGVYVPGRKTTVLADVFTLLSGVKGGSLMLRSDGDRNGHFSFYFWR